MSIRCDLLIIEDDLESSELLFDLFSRDYNVAVAFDGHEGVRVARLLHPQVILLDIRMPKLDGISTCAKLRTDEATRGTPVVMLSACDDEDHRTEAFRSGADDFVPKPFSTSELKVRVESKLRRVREHHDQGPSNVIRCGNLLVDVERMSVYVDGRPRALTLLEFQLVRYLVENRERVLSRPRILEAVWKDTTVIERTVDTHVSSLRRKLEGFDHVFQTVHGVGYMLRKNM